MLFLQPKKPRRRSEPLSCVILDGEIFESLLKRNEGMPVLVRHEVNVNMTSRGRHFDVEMTREKMSSGSPKVLRVPVRQKINILLVALTFLISWSGVN